MACLSPEVGANRSSVVAELVCHSSAREDGQDDVSSPCQVNDRMLGRLGNVWRCVLESPVKCDPLIYIAFGSARLWYCSVAAYAWLAKA